MRNVDIKFGGQKLNRRELFLNRILNIRLEGQEKRRDEDDVVRMRLKLHLENNVLDDVPAPELHCFSQFSPGVLVSVYLCQNPFELHAGVTIDPAYHLSITHYFSPHNLLKVLTQGNNILDIFIFFSPLFGRSAKHVQAGAEASTNYGSSLRVCAKGHEQSCSQTRFRALNLIVVPHSSATFARVDRFVTLLLRFQGLTAGRMSQPPKFPSVPPWHGDVRLCVKPEP